MKDRHSFRPVTQSVQITSYAARRRKVIGLGSLAVLLALIAGGFYWRYAQQRDAQQRAFLETAARYKTALAANKKLADEYNRTDNEWDKAANMASKAAASRRDLAFKEGGDTPSLAYLGFAKAEQAEVAKLTAINTARSGIDDRIAANMETILPSDDVQRFRTDAQAFHSQVAVALGDWDTAAGMVVDNAILVRNGQAAQSSQSDIGHAYQQEGDGFARTENLYQAELADYNHLKAKMKTNLRDAELAGAH